MQDRLPKYPNRVMLKPVEGQPNTYDLVRADEPIQEGTPLNKGTLLDDMTCMLLELPETATPNDAFRKIVLPDGKFILKVTVTTPGGIPLSGLTVEGIKTASDLPCITNENGTTLGFSTANPVTIRVSQSKYNYLDMASTASQSVPLESGVINTATLRFGRVGITQKTFASSTVIALSPDVLEFDASVVGGGGNGGNGYVTFRDGAAPSGRPIYTTKGGGGGGAGNVSNKANIPNPNTTIPITIGAMGGGTTSIGSFLSAAGGQNGKTGSGDYLDTTPAFGGVGGGRGAVVSAYQDSSNDWVQVAKTPSQGGSGSGSFRYPPTAIGGSGGGGGAEVNVILASGGAGASGGGNGGYYNYNGSLRNGANGTLPGAGGGGGSSGYSYGYGGGSGYFGLAGVVWRYRGSVKMENEKMVNNSSAGGGAT